jgi:hypothetical protein
VCSPDCEGKGCGDDGCGGICGSCEANLDCTKSGLCQCREDKPEKTFDEPHLIALNEGEPETKVVVTSGDRANKNETLTICPAGNIDWFKFVLGKNAQKLTATTTADGKMGANFIKVDAVGNPLADQGTPLNENDQFTFTATLDANSTYLLGLKAFSEEATLSYTAEFRLECIPDCGDDQQCGKDGCGGTCGECDPGESCSEDGYCRATCTPDCNEKDCGDDGCSGSCGICDDDIDCIDFECVVACVPECEGKQCGENGCGGDCGICKEQGTDIASLTCAVCGDSGVGTGPLVAFKGDEPVQDIVLIKGNSSCDKQEFSSGKEEPDKAVMWLYTDTKIGETSLVVSFGAATGENTADGSVSLLITDAHDPADELHFQIKNDEKGSDLFSFNKDLGLGTVDVKWKQACDAGFVLGPLPLNYCLSMHFLSTSGLQSLVIKQPGSEDEEHPMAKIKNSPVVICGKTKKLVADQMFCEEATAICACEPDCKDNFADDITCGSDGCGAPCGSCNSNQKCNQDKICVPLCEVGKVFKETQCFDPCDDDVKCSGPDTWLCQKGLCKIDCDQGLGDYSYICVEDAEGTYNTVKTCCNDGTGCFEGSESPCDFGATCDNATSTCELECKDESENDADTWEEAITQETPDEQKLYIIDAKLCPINEDDWYMFELKLGGSTLKIEKIKVTLGCATCDVDLDLFNDPSTGIPIMTGIKKGLKVALTSLSTLNPDKYWVRVKMKEQGSLPANDWKYEFEASWTK